MAKFRNKPIVIEADQWYPGALGEHIVEVMVHGNKGFPAAVPTPLGPMPIAENHGFIWTLEGGQIVSPGDWIITGIQGEKYPCKSDIFRDIYEPVT